MQRVSGPFQPLLRRRYRYMFGQGRRSRWRLNRSWIRNLSCENASAHSSHCRFGHEADSNAAAREFTHHVKVVILGFPKMPHPDVQECESTQFPARPQSVAEITVVGQKPHTAFWVSILQSKLNCAVRGWFGSPFLKPHVGAAETICRRLRSRRAPNVEVGVWDCKTSDTSMIGPAMTQTW